MSKIHHWFVLLSSVISLSFLLYSKHDLSVHSWVFSNTPDTTFIGNRMIASGGKIMTDQDALMVLVEQGANLNSVEIYYSSINTLNSLALLKNSCFLSMLFILPHRSCIGLGTTHFPSDESWLADFDGSKVFSFSLQIERGWFPLPIFLYVSSL